MDWSAPLSADVRDAMSKLLKAPLSVDPFAGYVQAAVAAYEVRRRAEAEADAVMSSMFDRADDPMGDMFNAGFAIGAAEAMRVLSRACADVTFPACEVQGHG